MRKTLIHLMFGMIFIALAWLVGSVTTPQTEAVSQRSTIQGSSADIFTESHPWICTRYTDNDTGKNLWSVYDGDSANITVTMEDITPTPELADMHWSYTLSQTVDGQDTVTTIKLGNEAAQYVSLNSHTLWEDIANSIDSQGASSSSDARPMELKFTFFYSDENLHNLGKNNLDRNTRMSLEYHISGFLKDKMLDIYMHKKVDEQSHSR